MRVLLVEDEASLRQALTTGLEADGYRVDTAERGDTGLEMALSGEHDLILLDLMLPGMNGFQVCRQLRESKIATPILMLTAKDGEYDEEEGLDTGADDYLTKPFSYVVLLARMRALLRRATPSLATLTLGNLSVDERRRSCHRDETEIDLSPQEFDLLLHLLQTYPGVSSKSSILSSVWGSDEADENTLYLYIGYLRRKIDEPFGTNIIQTVRGVGYRLARP